MGSNPTPSATIPYKSMTCGSFSILPSCIPPFKSEKGGGGGLEIPPWLTPPTGHPPVSGDGTRSSYLHTSLRRMTATHGADIYIWLSA